MTKCILNRREFLRSAGTAAASVFMLGGATTILASNGAWAVTLKSLPQHEATVLLKMTRHLYPHDMLGDIYYADVVAAFDAKMAADSQLKDLVKQGIAELNGAFGVPWLKLSEGYQLDALKRIEAGTARSHGRRPLQQPELVADLRLSGQLLPGRRLPVPGLPRCRLDVGAGR